MAEYNVMTTKCSPGATGDDHVGTIENIRMGEVRDPDDLPPEELAIREEQRNHFSVWSTIGINYSLIATPLFIGTYLSFNIGVGGGPVYIYGYIVAILFQAFVCASLSEIAACFPHSSGQVYWASVLSPPRWARSISYWVGAFTAAAWFFWTSGTFLLASQAMYAVICISRSTFVLHEWHLYLGYLFSGIIAVVFNVPLFRYYGAFLRGIVVLINCGTILVLVSLLVRAHPKQSARTVFVDFVNETGWASDGLVFLVGMLPGITGVNGFDSSAHVADEMPFPAKQIPQVMLGTAVMASLAGLPMVIVYMFCVVNPENLLDPIGGQPIAQLFLDALDLLPLTIIITLMYAVLLYFAGVSMVTTVSRVFWSLAREDHLVGSKWLSRTSGRHNLPLVAILATTVLACLLGLLVFGPATALNAILGSGAVCFFISYTIPLVLLISNRRRLIVDKPGRYVNLGKFGLVVNCVAALWMTVMIVFLSFPQYLPITGLTMNYTVAVLAAVVIVFGGNWFLFARKRYHVPRAMRLE